MELDQILRSRSSVRNYDKRKVDPWLLKKIIGVGESGKALYEDILLHFLLIEDGQEAARKMLGYAGYFGKTIEAPHYIAAVTESKEGYLENLGYRMEQLMVSAFLEGLGTCWIEVLHQQNKAKTFLHMDDPDLRLLALTPIGYPKVGMGEKLAKSIIDKKSARNNLYEMLHWGTWNNQEGESDQQPWVFMLEKVRFAPSWANQQPWQFIIDGDTLILAVRREKKDGLNRNRIDGGIMMFYIEAMVRQKGMAGKWVGHKEGLEIKYKIPENYEILGSFSLNNAFE